MSNRTLYLMPPLPPGLCPECGVDHDPEVPHDAVALQYQYTIFARHGRWATWNDALSHCNEATQEAWRDELVKLGIDPNSTNVSGGR
jgi:hypothetical protein